MSAFMSAEGDRPTYASTEWPCIRQLRISLHPLLSWTPLWNQDILCSVSVLSRVQPGLSLRPPQVKALIIFRTWDYKYWFICKDSIMGTHTQKWTDGYHNLQTQPDKMPVKWKSEVVDPKKFNYKIGPKVIEILSGVWKKGESFLLVKLHREGLIKTRLTLFLLL